MFSKKEGKGKFVFFTKFFGNAITAVALFLFLGAGAAMAADGDILDISLRDLDVNNYVDTIEISVDNPGGLTAAVSGGTDGWAATNNAVPLTIDSVMIKSGDATANPVIFQVAISGAAISAGTGLDADLEVTYTGLQGAGLGTDYDSGTSELGAILTGDSDVGDTENDGAAPKIYYFRYLDNDADGMIDAMLFRFTEVIATSSVLSADDLSLSLSGDFTGAAFENDGTDLITSSVQEVVVTLGTESSAFDTYNDLATQITTQNLFSLEDSLGNINNTLGVQNVIDYDGAGPVFTAARTSLNNIVLTFSENIDVTTMDGSGYVVAGAIVTGNTDPAGSANTITLSTTGLTGTDEAPLVTYTQAAGTTVDAASNETPDSFSATAADNLAPIHSSANFTGDSELTVVFSETVTAVAGDFTNLESSSGAADLSVFGISGSGSDTIVITLNESLGNTSYSSGRIDIASTVLDTSAATNAFAALSDIVVTDGYAPVVIDRFTSDEDGDGQIDAVFLQFSEDMAADTTGLTVTVAGYVVASYDDDMAGDDEIMVILIESGSADTGATPSTQLTVAGNLADLNGISAATEGSGSAAVDEALPVVINRYTDDLDHNGQIDTIFLEFSEIMQNPISTTSVVVAVSGYGVTNIEDDIAGDDEIMVTLNESGTADTGATPTVQLNNGGALEDANGNFVDTENSDTASIDEAAPVTIDRYTSDEDGNGQIDAIFIQFSEPMENGLDTGGVTVDVTGYVVTAYDDDVAGDDEMMLTLTESGSNDTDAIPDVELTVVGNLEDVNANPADVDTGSTAAIDEANPVIVDFTYLDSDENGMIDRVNVEFSEDVVSASVLSPNDLLFTDVGDFAGSLFGTAAGDLIAGTVSNVDIDLGTEAIVVDTSENSGSIAVNSQNSFYLEDVEGNTNSTLGAQDNATFSDGAAPVIANFMYTDNHDANGKVDMVTVTFSEDVVASSELAANDFTFDNVGDFTSANFGSLSTDLITGTVSNIDIVLGTAATVVNTSDSGSLAISVSGVSSLIDVDGNSTSLFGAPNNATISDGALPLAMTVSIASDGNDSDYAKLGDVVTLTVITSEDVKNEVITIDGNACAIVAGVDDLHWTATYTMQTGDSEGVYLSYSLDFDDIANNSAVQITAATDPSHVVFDETLPTITIALDDYALTGGETAVVTFTFSETPVNFGDDDVSVENGTIDVLVNGGMMAPLVYTATFTPTSGVDDATNVISVGVSWEDRANNVPAGVTNSANYTVNTQGPTVIARSTYDANGNGKIDRIILEFSDNMGADITGMIVIVDGFPGASYTDSTPGDNEIEVNFSEQGGVDSSVTPDVQLTDVGNLEDVGGNAAIAEVATSTATDGIAPVIYEFRYVDNDGDGMIDGVDAYFSEEVVASSILKNSNLPFSNVGDFTDIDFGASATDLITGTITQLSFALDTESSVVDTFDNSGSFAIGFAGSANLDDAIGNTRSNTTVKSNTLAYVDGASPIVALLYDEDPANAGLVTVSAVYSEAIVGTPDIDIDQQGTTDISADAMTDSGDQITWTYDYTVVADNDGTYEDGIVTVGLSSIDDAAGNTANAPSGTIFTTDTTAPTLTITTNPASPSDDNSSLIIDFEFSEVVTGFDDSDVTLNFAGGGEQAVVVGPIMQIGTSTQYNLTLAGSDLTDFQALLDSETLVVSVTMSRVTDSALNSGVGFEEFTWTYDTSAPTAALTYSDSDKVFESGQVVTITATFDEAMTDAPVVKLALDNSELSAANMTKVSTTVYTYSYTVQSSADISTVTASLSVGIDAAGNVITATPTAGGTFEISTPEPAPSSSSSSGGSRTTYCTSVEYDVWQDICINNIQYRNTLVITPSSCTLTSFQRAGLEQACEVEVDTVVPEVVEEVEETVEDEVIGDDEAGGAGAREVGLDPEVLAKFIEAERSLITVVDEALSNRLSGRILLQVEQKGEAWYVNPQDKTRHFLGRPVDAFNVMRNVGLGISEKDFASFNGFAPSRLSGRILLRVEAQGEAYYVNPDDNEMYYLGRPADAFNAMRNLGLGISNDNIRKLDIK